MMASLKKFLIIQIFLHAPVFATAEEYEDVWQVISKQELIPLNKEATEFSLPKSKSKATVIVLWASWCEFCKWQMEQLRLITLQKNNQDIQFLAISVEENGSDARSTAIAIGFGYPLFYNPKQALFKKIQPPKLPMTFVLDQNKKPTGIYTGITTERMNLVFQRMKQTAQGTSEEL